MKEMKKIVFLYLIIFIFVVTVFSTFCLEKVTNKVELVRCELSEEYLEWEKLSEEEKENTIMPSMCKVENNNKKASKMMFKVGKDELPTAYDGREQGYTSIVKNQLGTNGCWSFSSTTALEYYANKKFDLNYIFSTRHMVYSTTRQFLNNQINEYGYNKVPLNGGNFFMSSNYFINSLGPVLESDMPFENNENTININEIQNKNVQLDVNDIVLKFDDTYGNSCSLTEIKQIKEYVYKYGSVAISTYMTESENYYNRNTSAFYYNGSENSNHAVLIVGWDDNYSKDNFSSTNKPSTNGAWIVQNSYGTGFGDNGYYYISYEDVHVCDIYMAIKNVDQKVEDNSYIHDTLGFNVFYGFTNGNIDYNTGYAMNVFTKEQNKKEMLKEVTLGSAGEGSYKIYYVEGNGKNKSISNMQLIGSGNLESIGYYTHVLENPILIDSDITDFSIVVYYDMKTTMPLALSSTTGTFYQYITIDDNKSFASYDGENWQDLNYVSNGTLIASIKAFTDDVTDDPNEDIEEEIKLITSNKYKIDQDNLLIYIQPNTSINEFIKNVEGIKTTYVTDGSVTYTGNVYTGLKVDNYTVIVFGDVTGDGYAKMNDVMMISSYIVNGKGLIDNYKLAADVNLDSSIKMNDVMKISNYIVEGGSI